jgi:hypothetical protein
MPANSAAYPNLLMNLQQDNEFQPIPSDYIYQDVGSTEQKIAKGHSPEGKAIRNFRVTLTLEATGPANFPSAFQLGSFVYRTTLCPDLPSAADYIHYLLFRHEIKPEIATRLGKVFSDEFGIPLEPSDFPLRQMGVTYRIPPCSLTNDYAALPSNGLRLFRHEKFSYQSLHPHRVDSFNGQRGIEISAYVRFSGTNFLPYALNDWQHQKQLSPLAVRAKGWKSNELSAESRPRSPSSRRRGEDQRSPPSKRALINHRTPRARTRSRERAVSSWEHTSPRDDHERAHKSIQRVERKMSSRESARDLPKKSLPQEEPAHGQGWRNFPPDLQLNADDTEVEEFYRSPRGGSSPIRAPSVAATEIVDKKTYSLKEAAEIIAAQKVLTDLNVGFRPVRPELPPRQSPTCSILESPTARP